MDSTTKSWKVYYFELVALAFVTHGLCLATNAVSEEPVFTEVIENITVPAGRNVKLACSVKNLGSFKVAWMHLEQSAILTVHNHVITRNPRISVSHDKHRTWFLHINNVQKDDWGRYVCQINTSPAKMQTGFLHVVVPPNIDDTASSSDVIVREGSNVSLVCKATGSPEPTIKWKRDDNTPININKTLHLLEWEGAILELFRISRLDMGAYLCIATNGVPPTVSKRLKVNVDFPPMLWIPHQLVGAPLGYSVTLECITEAYPTSLNYWTREDGLMIHESHKYRAENSIGDQPYKIHMRLIINNISERDFGVYKCVAKNPRGETDGTIRLYSPISIENTIDQARNYQVTLSNSHHNSTIIPNAKDYKIESKYTQGSNFIGIVTNRSSTSMLGNKNVFGDWFDKQGSISATDMSFSFSELHIFIVLCFLACFR